METLWLGEKALPAVRLDGYVCRLSDSSNEATSHKPCIHRNDWNENYQHPVVYSRESGAVQEMLRMCNRPTCYLGCELWHCRAVLGGHHLWVCTV